MSEELDELKTSIDGSYDRLKLLLGTQAKPDSSPTPVEPETPVDPPTVTGITRQQYSLVRRWINSVETGSPQGDYGGISRYRDGAQGSRRQYTLGAAQTTEAGQNIEKLLRRYMEADKENLYDEGLKVFFDYPDYALAEASAAERKPFEDAFRAAASDPDMKLVQDKFFEDVYFGPAFEWCRKHRFEDALSHLVVANSFIHSGGILSFLRRRFSATPLNERAWVTAYVRTRHDWLRKHSRPLLRKTIYRTDALLVEIADNNWDLSQPLVVNGITV